MLRLVKYLKPFTLSIFIIIVLLFTQAMCDLSLPEYMSNIVNTGIQQNGIENALPNVIRKSEMDKAVLFMSDEESDKVLSSYKLLDKDKLSKNDYQKYIKKYKVLENEKLYELKLSDKDKKDELNIIMGKAFLALGTIQKDGFKNVGEMGTNIPYDIEHFVLIENMPKEQLKIIREEIANKIKDVPESMIIQGSAIYIKQEYKNIGIDTDALQKQYIIITGLKMIGIALLSMLTSVFVAFMASRLSAGLGRDLRHGIFNKVESFSNTEFDKFGSSSLITRTTNDIQQVQNLIVMLLRVVFYAPILGVGGVIKVLASDSSMGWIIALAVAIISVIVIVMFVFAVPKFKIVQKLIDRLNLVTRESLTGMLVIRAFNTEKHEEKKFNKANTDLTKTDLFIARTMSLMYPLMMLVMNLITILIVWVGAHQIDAGVIQVGDMMAFIQYSMQIIMSFLMITMVSIMLPRALVSIGRIDEVLSTEPIIKDREEPKTFGNNFKGHIKFSNVSFKYADADECVLHNISFTAEPGKTTAFIGSTGSGKSTIINLIPRFHDVTNGQILIDGIDIRDVAQYELRDKIGYVPQKGVLFSGTIESNLKYGNENASEEELIESVKIAQALDFIDAKEGKFKTDIAQGGANVSGGQKQRLSIARALIKKPHIYIFDDTFSALDFKTEGALRKALKKVTKDSTVLVVAQRISTIMKADQIIVLDKGKIVGKGTHENLMKKCKVYQEIALSQLSKEELK